MNTTRIVVWSTTAALTSLLFFDPHGLFSRAAPTRPAPAPVYSEAEHRAQQLASMRKQQSWLQVPGTPIALDGHPVSDWAEVNLALHESGDHLVGGFWQRFHGRTEAQIPSRIEADTVVLRVRRSFLGFNPTEEEITLRRWFPRRSLFSRTRPSYHQRYEVVPKLEL